MSLLKQFWSKWKSVISRSKSVMSRSKYGFFTLGAVLWVFGLVDQLYSSAAMMKYLLMSLLLLTIAVL